VGGCDGVALAALEPTVKYHPDSTKILTLSLESGRETVPDGQFAWGESLLKCNEGVQRFPQDGWQSSLECKGIRKLNCESDRTSRYESRA
jgi:hypothetical protein